MFSLNFIRCALLALALAAAGSIGASAQQGGIQGSNPTEQAVTEQQVLQEFDRITGRITIPNRTAATLEQPQGREWRQFQTDTIPVYGGILLIGTLLLLGAFYLIRGRVRLDAGWSGVKLLRFGGFERFVHWFTAFCFIILGLTGLNIVFGKALILPLIGNDAFTVLSQWGKYFHNFLGIPFSVGVVLIFLIWVRDNVPTFRDWQWLKSGGGIVGHEHVPTKRFNFGQKLVFWSVVLFGVAISVTGYVLLFPFQGTTIAGMQLAQIIHSVAAIILIAVIFGHIYIGTLGMEGAFEAMGSGTVDRNWAREHHSLWAETAPVVEDGKPRPQGGMAAPAE